MMVLAFWCSVGALLVLICYSKCVSSMQGSELQSADQTNTYKVLSYTFAQLAPKVKSVQGVKYTTDQFYDLKGKFRWPFVMVILTLCFSLLTLTFIMVGICCCSGEKKKERKSSKKKKVKRSREPEE